MYNKIVTTQLARVKDLAENEEWRMLNNEGNLSKLQALYQAVQSKITGDFTKEWLTLDEVDVKKKYLGDNMDNFYFELRRMVLELNPVLEELDKFHARLYRMQQTSTQA